jgi:cation diffusion facilitator family transporter
MAESRTAVMAALLGNGALAVLKGVAAAATGSAAMLAETFHSVADTGNQALLFLGMRLAARPADREHPFGHGKNVYFWAFVVSMLLFSVGGAFAIWEAVRVFLHPEAREHGSLAWAYGVLAGGFVFEAISLGVALRALAAARQGRSLREFWRESRDPTLPTVVLEDSAALVSLVVAAGGLALGQATGNPAWDGVASAVIGALLIAVAVLLAVQNHSLLIGQSAPADVQAQLRRDVEADPEVVGVRGLHTMHVGPDALLIVVGVEFRPGLTTRRLEAVVARLHQRIGGRLDGRTSARLVAIEPTGGDASAGRAERADAGR